MPNWLSFLTTCGQQSLVTVAGVFARNLIPVVGILWFDWSASKYLLMIVFQFAFNLSLIGVAGATASTLIEVQRNARPVSRVNLCIQGAAIVAGLSALLTTMLGWPIVLQSSNPVLDRGWWYAVAVTVVMTVPGVLADVHASTAAGLSNQQIKAQVQQRAMFNIVSIVPIVGMYWMISDSRSIGTIVVVVVYAAFSIVRDLCPDLGALLAQSRSARL